MASVALGAVGAGIGGAFGGVAGAELGFSVGITIGGLLFPPKQKNQDSGRIKDLRVGGSGYGSVIPQIFGSMRVAGNIIWATDLVEHSKSRSGKGTRSSSQRQTTYSVSVAMAVCRGPIGRIGRIWAEDVIIYDDTDSPASKYNIQVYFGDETQLPNNTIKNVEGVSSTPAFRGLAYCVYTDWDLSTWGNRIPSTSYEVLPAISTNYTVGQILESLFLQAGLTTNQYDVTDATDVVTGFTITGREAVRDSVADMLRVYNTDLVEIDGKIFAKKRGSAPIITIPTRDMASRIDSGGGSNSPDQNVTTKRKQDLELPFRLDLAYFSTTSDYQQAAQGATRYTKVNLQDATTVGTSLTLNDDQARQAAEKILHQMWIEREEFELTVPIKYAYLCPGDVVNLTVGSTDNILRARIMSMDIALFGPIKLSCVLDDISVLTQVTAGAAVQSTTAIKEVADTDLVAWSSNAIRDADASNYGYYVSLGGGSTWPGAQLYWSRDAGSSYQILDTVTDRGIFGTATTVLPPEYDSGWDTINTVDVTLTSGADTPPVSTSDADVISGSNAAMLGDEIIQFATVTPLGGNSYRLSRLLRGRRGTENHSLTHVIGDRFVLLEVGRVHRYNVGDDLYNKTIYLKAISTNQALGDVSPVTVTVTGREWLTYSPVQPSEVVSP